MSPRNILLSLSAVILAIITIYGITHQGEDLEADEPTVESGLGDDDAAPADSRVNNRYSERLEKSDTGGGAVKPPTDFLTNSVFPDNPLELYQRQIANAENGDVEAQYDVYRAALECQYAIQDYETLEKFRSSTEDTALVTEMEFLFERCDGLRSLVGDINGVRKKWYAEAVRSGHPIAKGHYLAVYGKDLSEARETISIALSSGRHQAFEIAAIYVGRVQGEHAPMTVEPWSYLACERNPGCNVSAYEQQIVLAKYQQHDLEEIIRQAREIERNIQDAEYGDILPYYFPSTSQ